MSNDPNPINPGDDGANAAASAESGGPPPRRPLAAWKKALFAGVAAVFLLAFVELTIRLALPPVEVRGPFERPPDQITNRDVSVFLSDPLLFWRLRPNVQKEDWDFTQVTTNEMGLRYGLIRKKSVVAREAGRPVFRILCVGDSVTFGYRTPMGSTFAAALERTLNSAFPARRWEVIPLACPGYSSLQSLENLRRHIRQLDPDFLILNSGWNDIVITEHPDKLVFQESQAVRSLQGWLRHSQTYLRLRRWLLEARPAADPPPARREAQRRVSKEDYCANVLAMAALGKKHEAPVLVLNFFFQKIENPNDNVGTAVPAYRAALAEACAAQGQPYMTIPFLTEAGWPANKKFFGEPVHPTDCGHYLIARKVFMWMLETNTLGLSPVERTDAAKLYAPLYGSSAEMNFESEFALSFGPETMDAPATGPLALSMTPSRGLRRLLFQDRHWKGPLLQAQIVPDINHLLADWDDVLVRPVVPPYSARWDGWLMIPEPGEWGIGTSSDDGSFVFLDGKLWLNNDGVHGPGVKLSKGWLEAGPHELTVFYFDVGYGAEMRLLWQRPLETDVLKAEAIPADNFRMD